MTNLQNLIEQKKQEIENRKGHTFQLTNGLSNIAYFTKSEVIDLIEKYGTEIAQATIEEVKPEISKAHTYSSENADEYRASDNGYNSAISDMEQKAKTYLDN